jgi:WD40 repeat protein
VALSPEGEQILSGALSGTVYLWNATTGRIIHRLDGHTGAVLGAAFGPHGRFAVTSSRDGSLILWDLDTGEAIRRHLAHRGEVTDICVAPGGRTLYSVGADLTLREWRIDITQEALMSWIRGNRYVPALTPAQRRQYQLDLLDAQPAPVGRIEGRSEQLVGKPESSELAGREDRDLEAGVASEESIPLSDHWRSFLSRAD